MSSSTKTPEESTTQKQETDCLYADWVKRFLDPWCRKHGIDRRQALGILFFDNRSGISKHDVLSVGKCQKFSEILMREMSLAYIDPPKEPDYWRITDDGPMPA